MNKPKAILVDIDGTLAHMNGKRGAFDWKNVGVDDLDAHVAEAVEVFRNAGYIIVVMSGRDSRCMPETLKWLNDKGVKFHHLFMRAAHDYRKDSIVKRELFDRHVADNWDVRFVLDDRDQVVDMWREMGLKCFQVERGNF